MASVGIPLLETLTAGARAAYPVIRGLVAAGYGGQEVYDMLRTAGLGARKSDVLAIVRYENNAALAASDISHYLKDVVPDLSRIREAATKIIAPFSYTIAVSLYDPYTGESSIVHRQAHSQNLLSPNEAAAKFLELAPDGVYDGDQVIKYVQTVDIVRAGSQGVL